MDSQTLYYVLAGALVVHGVGRDTDHCAVERNDPILDFKVD